MIRVHFGGALGIASGCIGSRLPDLETLQGHFGDRTETKYRFSQESTESVKVFSQTPIMGHSADEAD